MTEKEERLPTHPLAKHMPSNEWLRDKIESDPDDAEVEVRPSGAYTDAVHEFAMSYESRDPDYTPTDHERALIEDAINSFIAEPPARSIDAGDGWVLVPREPTEAQWGGLARAIVMWWGMGAVPTGALLHQHLTRTGEAIPDWLHAEIPVSTHVPSKGTVAACIYRAMLAAAPPPAAKEAE